MKVMKGLGVASYNREGIADISYQIISVSIANKSKVAG